MVVCTRRLALKLIMALPVSGCMADDLPLLPTQYKADYEFGPGDQIRVIVFDEKQLSHEYRVDAGGMIDMPLVGGIRAAGYTAIDLARLIARKLQSDQLILKPSVAVEIVEYRPFYILGEVNKPGPYPYQPGMTVLSAVSIAGGFTYRAVQAYVGVTRAVDGPPRVWRAAAAAQVKPGDVITVFERHF
ncbi:MAG TPA: polysaccharide biosynthesis/export family protein [Acetobacteraceae bacterium]|nr:polysaccharide biosynthesis/export family protein [Acetobacteraceae bacterium]